MKDINIHKGDLLIASPLLKDPNFYRTVVLILDRDKDRGFIGLILNRPLELTIEEILSIKETDLKIPVFNGGPVDLQRLFWLHSLGPDKISGSTEVIPGVYIGGNFENLEDAILKGIEAGGNFRLYLGYCGWTKGQLENEIENGVWKVNSLADPTAILTADPDSFWRESVKALGPSARHWLMLPPDPSMN